mmetsp:Transcript_3497/g.6959  ORF Transcript_3497/g.6959 Transcript_3497/m.6959 type:complete len:310 (-) Transcript_3497:140-1069(-)
MTTTSKNFDISQLPSLKGKNAMTVEQESMTRRKTCRFIEEAGRQLKFQRLAISTAEVFFHRFYAKHSFNDHDRFEVAVAAILLAGKTEETPRKLNTVIDECYKLKVRGQQAGRISTQSGAPIPSSPTLDPKSDAFAKIKERVLLMERVILHTIGFELSIDHPYPFILEQISKLVNGKKVEPRNAAAGTNPSVFTKLTGDWKQYAMNFANDSMQTSLCLQFPPQKIASAMVFLAALFIKVQPTAGRDWPDILEHGDVETLASITLQVLELIQERKNVHTETFEKIKIEIIKLRDNKDSSMEPQAKRIREG